MRVWISLGIFLLSTNVSAQTMRSLFPSEGLAPHLSVPFEISDSGSIQIEQIIFDKNDAQCKFLTDAFYKQNFHIRCAVPGAVQFRALFRHNDALKSLSSTLLTFAYPSGATVVDPNPIVDPTLLEGQQLFSVYCVECHSPSAKVSRTALQINTAYTNNPVMRAKANQGYKPSAAEINKISAYLGSLK